MTPNRRALLVLLATLLGAAATCWLGFWQLDRAAQKNALQAALENRHLLPPMLLPQLATTPALAARQLFRPVALEGRWLDEHTVYLDNRQMNGHPGFYVLTPLLLADGSAVVVQRGWEPRNISDRSQVVPPRSTAPAAAAVRVVGHIAPAPARLLELGHASGGLIRQNLELAAFAVEIKRPLRPLTIVQEDGPQAPADGLQRQWPQPAAGSQRNYGYAFQWFAMATLILGLYVWFQLIRPRRRA